MSLIRSPSLWLAVVVLGYCGATLAASEDAAERAKAVLDATGVQGGLVVHVGCGDGTLTAALRANERYLVQGLAADPQKLTAARRNIRAAGVNASSGSRVAVALGK